MKISGFQPFQHTDSSPCSWRWLFIIEGAATIVWAGIASFLLLDFPANTKRLTDRERLIATARLRGSGIQTYVSGDVRIGKLKSFRLAIMDYRTIGLVLGYMVSSLSCLSKPHN